MPGVLHFKVLKNLENSLHFKLDIRVTENKTYNTLHVGLYLVTDKFKIYSIKFNTWIKFFYFFLQTTHR